MNFEGRDVLSISDFSREELLQVMEKASEIEKDPGKFSESLKGKIVATLFFEPSTRTRMSFQAAMQRMGGSVIGFSDVSTSSMKKGESLPDTIRIVSGYCDVIVMRHPEPGSVAKAADAATVPVINAGDGPHEHPTQTILDIYTIMKERGGLDGLKIGFVGDLKHGRTVHSLVTALHHFSPELFFISPEQLRMPPEYVSRIREKGISYRECSDLKEVSGELDVIYVTRVQSERFESREQCESAKRGYRLDASIADCIKEDAIILHPLPRVDEMDPELDRLKQSIYFKQAHNGIPVRMALLGLVLGKSR